MDSSSKMVRFLYRTTVGRCLLKTVMVLHLDRIAVWFLRSPLSKVLINRFLRRNNISVTPEQRASFRSYRDMFARTQSNLQIDPTPEHLISPCDGLLSAFPIDESSSFAIKNSHYQLKDFLQDEALAQNYIGGTCLIFRLCVSDYHHYCYIDDAFQGENHFIPGALHSVQPIACETYPVFVLNRRSWCLMNTANFGPVVQCEIGALVVGGIVNEKENEQVCRGTEKGRFDLAGSTIILLFEPGKIALRPELSDELLRQEEVRVTYGSWIGNAL